MSASEVAIAPSAGWIEKFKKAEMALLFVLWAAVGVLQMKRIRFGLFTPYGADVFLPAWLYLCARENRTVLRFVRNLYT